jgi:hypothetical protein
MKVFLSIILFIALLPFTIIAFFLVGLFSGFSHPIKTRND